MARVPRTVRRGAAAGLQPCCQPCCSHSQLIVWHCLRAMSSILTPLSVPTIVRILVYPRPRVLTSTLVYCPRHRNVPLFPTRHTPHATPSNTPHRTPHTPDFRPSPDHSSFPARPSLPSPHCPHCPALSCPVPSLAADFYCFCLVRSRPRGPSVPAGTVAWVGVGAGMDVSSTLCFVWLLFSIVSIGLVALFFFL
jgi:hypothetical protein